MQQRQIVINTLTAVFTKDFDSFGKMDPLLEFKLGKNLVKTQVAKDMGKEPKWTAQVKLSFFDESQIQIKAFDEDLTQNQYIGAGKLDLKTIKDSDSCQVQIFGANKQSVGKISLKYTLEKLNPSPLLFIKNITCNFDKETKFLLKAKPYLQVSSQDSKIATQKKQSDKKTLHWDDNLRIRIKQDEPINFTLLDAEDNNSKIFYYEASYQFFRVQKGQSKFFVYGSDYEPLGTLSFDFQTLNVVNQAESTKNKQKMQKDCKQLTHIQISKINGKMLEGGNDIYFKILVGSNMTKTKTIQNAKKDFTLQQKIPFYAQSKQTRITFATYDKNLISDQMLGVGYIYLKVLSSGDKTIELKNKQGKAIGSIVVSTTFKKVVSKKICLSKIHLKMDQSSDIISKQDPYVIFTIGGWSGRTQTGQGKEVKFTKSLELKYSQDRELKINVWEQDLSKHDSLGEQTVTLKDLGLKGEKTVDIILKQDSKEKKVGTLSFSYEIQAPPEKVQKVQKKISQKKITQKSIPQKKLTERSDKQSKKVIEQPISNVTFEPAKIEHHHQSLDDRSIDNKSNNVFRLPDIGDASKNFGDRIFDKQSSATLQKSILVYSMPKGQRFNSGPKYSGQPSYYVDTCFKPNSSRGVGFGFGNKRQFPEWMQRNMKQNPAPGSYFDHGNRTQFRPRGPTFGISHKYYQKVTIPKETSKDKNVFNKSSQRLKPLRRNS